MAKKRLFIFGGLVFLVFVIDLMFYFGRGSTGGVVSGYLIKEVSNNSLGLNLSLIAFIGQWIVLLSIVLFAYTRFLRSKKNEEAEIQTKNIKLHILIVIPVSVRTFSKDVKEKVYTANTFRRYYF